MTHKLMEKKISEGLDYNIELTEDRMVLVKELIEQHDSELVAYYDSHYNPHISQDNLLSEYNRVSKDLESMANYLLYSKDGESNDDTITVYKEKRNTIREGSINNVLIVREARKETNRSIIKYPKIKVNKKDREVHPELKASGDVIKTLTGMINTGMTTQGKKLQLSEVKKLKWIRTDIQKDEIVVKNELKKYIRFNSVTKVEKDHNALSFIQFDNPEIIRILIEDYGDLKEDSYDDTFGYMKVILFAFEELVELSGMEDYMLDILKWKIEKTPQEDIIAMLKEKHNITMKKPVLSETTRRFIPNIIVNTYKQQREDWVYTYVFKGNYRTCTTCGENKLSSKKYYSPAKVNKSGLRSQCKECRKIKSKSSPAPKL